MPSFVRNLHVATKPNPLSQNPTFSERGGGCSAAAATMMAPRPATWALSSTTL